LLKILDKKGLELLLLAILLPPLAGAEQLNADWDGHLKTRIHFDSHPTESIFTELGDSTASSIGSDLRLNFSVDNGPWSFDSAWQISANYGDKVALTRELENSAFSFSDYLINDDRRLMNLTDEIRNDGKFSVFHRLDRLSLTYKKENLVVTLGRQAITWGNGLIFSPMDIVNPFSPTVVDTEYKTGDDMVYGQYLLASGDDIQVAHVFRDKSVINSTVSSATTTAVKYHGMTDNAEYDVLLARSYGATTMGLGASKSLGGAVIRGDAVWIDTMMGHRLQLVMNVTHSWIWGGRNISGTVEYYFNELGQSSGRYDYLSLYENTELLNRLERNESFTLGRNYLAGGMSIEMNPLWIMMPNVFWNLDDGSAMVQWVTRNSLADNAELVGAVNIPVGPTGSEFRGIDASDSGVYFSSDFSVFLQLAWYF